MTGAAIFQRFLLVAVSLALAASGCQLILGFEEHELLPGSGGGPQGGGPIGGTPDTGGNGGDGGQPPVELDLFDEPEELHAGLGSVDAVAMADDGTLFFLEQTGGTHQVQRRSTGGVLAAVETDLVSASGFGLTDAFVVTATGPVDGADTACHVLAIDRAGIAPPLDLVHETCSFGQQRIETVAASGNHVAFTILEGSGNTKSQVRRAEVTDVAVAGSTIGFGGDKDVAVPSIVILGESFVWVDSNGARLLENEAGVPTGGQPPGDDVEIIATLASAREVVRGGSFYFVATASAVFRVAIDGELFQLASAENPRGLSVDDEFVYWAEPSRVRAVRLSDLAISTVATVGDAPTGTASDGSAVFFGTSGGRIVRVFPLE